MVADDNLVVISLNANLGSGQNGVADANSVLATTYTAGIPQEESIREAQKPTTEQVVFQGRGHEYEGEFKGQYGVGLLVPGCQGMAGAAGTFQMDLRRTRACGKASVKRGGMQWGKYCGKAVRHK